MATTTQPGYAPGESNKRAVRRETTGPAAKPAAPGTDAADVDTAPETATAQTGTVKPARGKAAATPAKTGTKRR